jgi:hypothetical protein
MAQHTIFTFQLKTNEYEPAYPLFTINRWVKIYWDDVTETVRVYISESSDPTGVPVGEALSGPYISGSTKMSIAGGKQAVNPGYSFCDGLTLVNHRINITGGSRSTWTGPYDFPYVIRTDTPNHWSCDIHQCNIDFDLIATDITEDSGSGDGSILVAADSDAGPVKFTLNPNAVYTDGDTFFPDGYPGDPDANSYTFTGLAAASYTVYALDTFNCKAQLTVIVPVTAPVYGVRWRLLFEDIKVTADSRVDIEEKDYVGEITLVQMTGTPVIRSWRGESVEDIFNTIISYQIDIQLISSTDFQFIDLFTQDERQFRVKSYRNDILNFVGYVTPMFYSEPYYTKENYPVNIVATDQIGNLKDLDFTDDFGNIIRQEISFLEAISIILRKTDIDIDIFEAVNIYAEGMDGTPINFLNPSFEAGVLTPFVNITTEMSSYAFQWFFGNVANSDPPGGSFGGTPALAQVRPNSIENWPLGDYTIEITGYQSGATLGMTAWLYGFDDEAGNGREIYSPSIGGLVDGAASATISGTVTVDVSKKYLGVALTRNGPSGLHEVTIEDINITASPNDTEQSSSLQQCFIDPGVYLNDGEPLKCDEVLNALLISFGARLYQAFANDNLYWVVESIGQKSGTVNYRIFNLNGELQDYGTVYSTVDILQPNSTNRISWINRSALLSILPSYNKISFTIELNFDNNLLPSSFESGDIIEQESGAPQIIGWTYDLTNGDGVGFGLDTLTNETGVTEENKSALFVDFSDSPDYREIIFLAEEFDLDKVSSTDLVFGFDVYFRGFFQDIYSYIDYSLKIGDKYAQPNGGFASTSTSALIEDEWIRVYIDKPLSWTDFSVKIVTHARSRVSGAVITSTLEGPVILKIRISNNRLYDYDSITDLRAQPTLSNEVGLNNLIRVKVLDDDDVIRFYKHDHSFEADNYPDLIRPNDYVSISNTSVWVLEKTVTLPDRVAWLNGVLIDNIKMGFDEDFPESLTYSKENNPNIKLDLPRDIIHSDLALYPEDIEDVPVYDTNFQRLLKNWIRFSDGTPTSLWFRGYSEESRSLIDILMRMYQGQLSSPSFKFTGELDTDVSPSLFNLFREVRLDKKLIAMALSIHDHNNVIEAELLELKTGSEGEPPADIYEFTEEFTTEFDS